MPRNVGFWPGSASDVDTLSIDFGPNLQGATIVGIPTVTGVNCTPTYVGMTAAGVVSYKTGPGTYAGSVAITINTSDGREITRQVEHRFL